MGTQKTHWLKNDDKKYLGAWDLPENEDLILTIKKACWEIVENPKKNGAKENKRVIHFAEKGYKPMIVNETNSLNIIQSTGIKYMEDTVNCKIALYKIEGKWFGVTREAIRVRPTPVKTTKPKLTPNHPKWDAAKKSKADINVIRKHYDITDEDYKLLMQ